MRSWQEHGKKFLELIPAAGKSAVDVGCGDGWAALRLREKGATVMAVDLLPPEHYKLAELREHGVPYSVSFDGVCGYDYVWCHHVLEHIQDPIAFLQQLGVVGKQLWLAVPRATLKGFAKGHIHNYTLPLLVEHLRLSGWDVKNGAYTTFPSTANLWVVVNRWEGDWLSLYPPPMEALNGDGNSITTDFNTWNWEKITKGEEV